MPFRLFFFFTVIMCWQNWVICPVERPHGVINTFFSLCTFYRLRFGSCCSVAQSCPALCDPRHGSMPGSSVRGISQAGILEWVAIPFSRGSSRPRDQTRVSCIAGGLLTVLVTRVAHMFYIYIYIYIYTHTHTYILIYNV